MTSTLHTVLPPDSSFWKRPLIADLIGREIDLNTTCAQCSRPLLDHEGPLIEGYAVNGNPAPLYGDEACADASALLPGDVWDGGWVGHGEAA